MDDRLVHATCNVIGADRVLGLVSGSSVVSAARGGLSATVVALVIRCFRSSVEGVRVRGRSPYGSGCTGDPMTRAHEIIFHRKTSSSRTGVFGGVLIHDREFSADEAGSIFVVDFMANTWFGRGPRFSST